ncbi:zinc finger protein 25-like [Metopolophium dirhodum]|uniref:zinc finger protein 25-like n=1 Tax=Metopolophium dirhodum TaxID=44670 RepID=UPI00298FCF25|nr:zinc finger protein 25-like [Metopolophium dirhodum]
MNVEKFFVESFHANYQHLNKNGTRGYNLNEDEWTQRVPIDDASADGSLFKKKKKKKKGDKQMVQNEEGAINDKTTLNFDKLYDEVFHDNHQYLNKNETRDSNLNKDEWTRRIPFGDASEDGSLIKKKKMKLKEDKQMVKDSMNDKAALNVDTFYNDTLTNDMILNKDKTRDLYLNKDECTRRIPVAYASEGDSLLKSQLKNTKKKKKISKVVNNKEVMSPKKSNKRKRRTYFKEYSKNDTPQSADTDMETYVTNNYIGEDVTKKLEFIDSLDDQTSGYRTMTDTSMYFGLYCNQTSNNAYGVHGHENVFTGKTPLWCDVCFKTFTYISQLVIHKRTHTGEKPYGCDFCGKSFSAQSHLVRHIRTHTGERPYVCNVCGKSFARQDSLVIHNRTHTGERPYACNFCGKSFARQDSLVIHNRTHTGEKPFECGFCGKKFSSSSGCRTHTLGVHKEYL